MPTRWSCDRRAHDRLTAAAGLGAFIAGGVLARRDGVSELERRCFRAVNGLPAGAHAPVWAVMQLGSLGGALGVGGMAAALGRPALGRRLAIAGGLTWGAAKVVKTSAGRGRPAAALEVARILGKPAGGLGYPSGHAAVATSLAAVAAGSLNGPWRRVAWLVALAVGPARLYVGAHLPLDVAGGIGLGLAVGAAVRSSHAGSIVPELQAQVAS